MADTLINKSQQFQQNVAAYLHTCLCGWTHETIMGRGELGLHRAAIHQHGLACQAAHKES